MSQITYAENTNNLPFGLANTNAPGSPYAAAYSRGVTNHLSLPVDPIIFDAQPQQFLDLQYLMAFSSREVPGDEVIWQENVWSRSPVVVGTTFAGTAASAGTEVTGTVVVTSNSTQFIYPGQQLYYRGSDGVFTQCVVVSITGTNMVIRSQTGAALAPVAAGTAITNGMTLGSDGQSTFAQPSRLQTVQRTNLIEKIGPEQRIWNHLERIKFKNQAQTNYMEQDMRTMLTQLKVSVCQRIWIGKYGQNVTPIGAGIAKNTEGFIPAIQNNGGATLNSTMSTVWDDITTGIFATNFGPLSNERVIFGTPDMLYALNMKQKAEFVRYSYEDQTLDLNFERWRIGGQTITLVPIQIWGDQASFPEEYARRLVVMQKQNANLVTMRGVPMMRQEVKVSQSRSNTDPFEIYDFERYTVEAMVGTELHNASGSFIVDVS